MKRSFRRFTAKRSNRSSFGRNRHFASANVRKKYMRRKINPAKYVSNLQSDDTTTQQEVYTGKDFTEFGLTKDILKRLEQKRFAKTTKVQEETIPHIQKGRDILGISATGSGKTGAFLIPLIDRIYKDNTGRILVVAPTRELAQQIFKEAISLVRGSRIRLALVIGGESISRQIASLRKQPEILIGTPGRLLDLENRNVINFSTFNIIVIDEVDRMLDMGFIDDIKHIYSQLAKDKQALFFSATINPKIEKIINDMSPEHKIVQLSENKPVANVEQRIEYYSGDTDKINRLYDILSSEDMKKALVFVNTKRYADRIIRTLREKGLKAEVIHGDKSQFRRRKALDAYRKSAIDILVATNVAARGIDVKDISHVINLDEPDTYDEYIHRIGRTGRNGKKGKAITFVKK